MGTNLVIHIAAFLLCLSAWQPAAVLADTVQITSIADTSIVEVAPTNNAGGRSWVNAGSNMAAQRNRGLFQFDIAGNIPARSRITSATLYLSVTGIPADGYGVGTFTLHRLLRAWGEGNKNPAMSPGRGAPATVGEADWLSPLALTTNVWAVPGGAPDSDYASAGSGSQIVYDGSAAYSPYAFPDPSEDQGPIIADVQLWLDKPATNFGWMLICDDESVTSTARRFGSREDPNNAPMLNIGFTPPLFGNRAGNSFQLQFPAQAGQAYAIDYAATLVGANHWIILTNIGAPLSATNIVVLDSLTNAARFYRLRPE